MIRLTHVCRSWRELLISQPLLWSRLDCIGAEKTKAYIERSKSCPLEICLGQPNDTTCNWEEGFILTVPHVGRLGTLSVFGTPAKVLPVLIEHFSHHVPLLNNLKIVLICDQPPSLPDGLLDGDLSSLHELSLAGVITPLPWRGLSNLTSFNLCHIPEDKIILTQLLHFLESTPRLRYIHFHDSIPDSSDAPAGRVISLPRLEELTIIAQPPHSVFLDHLSVPVGASLCLGFSLTTGGTPIRSYLPKSLSNLRNLSHITATHLHFGLEERSIQFNGPSGELYMFGVFTAAGNRINVATDRFLLSLDRFDISRNQWLAITLCNYQPPASARVDGWIVYQTLRSMGSLRILTLAECNNLPFIRILNPNENTSNTVLCQKLEEIILHIRKPDQFRINDLLRMAEERALRGAKLSAILIVSLDVAFVPTEEAVFQLRKHVSRVEHKFDDVLPEWDTLPVM